MDTLAANSPEIKYLGLATIKVDHERITIMAPRRASFRFLFGPAFALLVAWFSPKLHNLLFSGEPGSGVSWTFLSLLIAKGIWDATSRDIITVDEKQLVIYRGIFRLGWKRRYPLREIGRLRWAAAQQVGNNMIPSRILFDYEYMPVACAWDIGEPGANQIIELIKSRFPEIGTAAQVSVF